MHRRNSSACLGGLVTTIWGDAGAHGNATAAGEGALYPNLISCPERMKWIGASLASDYWALDRAFRSRPFSTRQAQGIMGGPPGQRNLRLSRLAHAGWLARIGRGRYAALGPLWVRSRPDDPLASFRMASFFPELAIATALTVRTFGPRLRSLALFGSCARGSERPDSDIDLLVIADPIPSTLAARIDELHPIVEEATEFALDRRQHGQGTHIPQIVLLAPEELRAEPPLLLDLTQDARILFDPEDLLRGVLDRLRGKLERLGSRRVRAPEGWEYWVLKPGARVGEVEEV